MRKLSKKISMLMVLAMLVSLFSGIVSASAASAWSFKSSKYDVEVGETIEMEKNEYADFDLFKNDAAPAGYTVKWSSSDVDTVYVNGKTGQLRADKYGKADFGDKATISATFTNTATGKSATRSFVIVVAEKAEYEIEVNFGDEVLAVGQKYDLKAVVKADGKEVEAKVEFAIDGKAIDAAYTPAAEGEFTIVTTATIDGKVVAEEKTAVVVVEAGLLAAKQITFDTVALTFGSADAAKVAANSGKIGSVYYNDKANNEIQAFIEKAVVDANDATVVNVTLYNDLIKDYTYKFSYADKAFEVKGADLDTNTAVRISFATTSLKANNYATADQQVYVNFFNADDILIARSTPNVLEAMNHDAYNINGNAVFFHKADAKAALKATVWRGYAADGTKIPDLVAEGVVTSYDASAYGLSNVADWTIAGLSNTPAWGNWSSNNSIKVAIGENKILGFRVTKTPVGGGQYNVMFKNGVWSVDDPVNQDAATNVAVWFESSNENVVLIDKTQQNGAFYPVGPGNAQIIVYRYATYDTSWDKNTKEVIGVYNVEVVKERTLTSVAPTFSKNFVSVAVDGSDFVKLYINAKDQTGAAINFANYTAGLKLMPGSNTGVTVTLYSANDANTTNLVHGADYAGYTSFIRNDQDGKGDYFKIKVTGAPDAYAVPLHFGVQVTNGVVTIKDCVATLNAKAPQSWSVGYRFENLKNTIDTNLVNWDWNNNLNAYQSEIKLAAYDAAGYLYETYGDGANEFFAGETAARAAIAAGSVTGDVFYYTITKNTEGDSTSLAVNNMFTAVTNNSGVLTKGAANGYQNGTYVIKAYKIKQSDNYSQFLTNAVITVTDTTPAVTAVKLDNKLSNVTLGGEAAAIKTIFNTPGNGKISFMRNGSVVGLTVNTVTQIAHVNAASGRLDRVNVQKVNVIESIANGQYTTSYDVDVYFSYEIQ